jgi:hypothetical protein
MYDNTSSWGCNISSSTITSDRDGCFCQPWQVCKDMEIKMIILWFQRAISCVVPFKEKGWKNNIDLHLRRILHYLLWKGALCIFSVHKVNLTHLFILQVLCFFFFFLIDFLILLSIDSSCSWRSFLCDICIQTIDMIIH